MPALTTPASLVHYYDTHLHEILCGLQGFEYRSTKHSRGVTCQACVGLLHERRMAPVPGPAVPTLGNASV